MRKAIPKKESSLVGHQRSRHPQFQDREDKAADQCLQLHEGPIYDCVTSGNLFFTAGDQDVKVRVRARACCQRPRTLYQSIFLLMEPPSTCFSCHMGVPSRTRRYAFIKLSCGWSGSVCLGLAVFQPQPSDYEQPTGQRA